MDAGYGIVSILVRQFCCGDVVYYDRINDCSPSHPFLFHLIYKAACVVAAFVPMAVRHMAIRTTIWILPTHAQIANTDVKNKNYKQSDHGDIGFILLHMFVHSIYTNYLGLSSVQLATTTSRSVG